MSSPNATSSRPGGDVPYAEPLRATVVRTVAIAIVAGALASAPAGGLRAWPALTVVMLWPSFGGHWVEILYLNVMRPRIPANFTIRAAARLATWFAAGVAFAYGMRVTGAVFLPRMSFAWLTWASAGIGFIGVELIAHAALQARGQPSFYNGRG